MNLSLKTSQQASFNYSPIQGIYDEMVAENGDVRPAWQYIVESLGGLEPAELDQRRQKALRILRDDGATYNVYDAEKTDNTWLLDLIPWVIPSDEWTVIEAGLQERAELFNLILADIYGDRELIARGIVPPELILGHKAFLRSCQGISLPGEHQLIIHSVDLIRRPDGAMCVLADRTQAPSGMGYALENRTVMSRLLPSLFRDSHVHRLASYFRSLRHKLMDLMPHVKAPRIVVLTPGAYNEAYFEHSYLANYMGFSLVQSGDLVVRGGNVFAGYRVSKTVSIVSQKNKGRFTRGDVIKVRITVDANAERNWVVVSDPVPPGATIIGNLGGQSGILGAAASGGEGVSPSYVERGNDAWRGYFEWVPRGQFVTEYALRLNGSGRFTLPPTRVEAMYSPDIRGSLPNAPVVVGIR